MSKWDTRTFNRKPDKVIKDDPICRVVPPLLARIPNIADWLFKSRKLSLSRRVYFDLKKAYRDILELKEAAKNEGFDTYK